MSIDIQVIVFSDRLLQPEVKNVKQTK